MEIINSGQYRPETVHKEEASGFGLTNSKQRLNFIFGNKVKFQIKNLTDKEVITILKIPKNKL
jgi:LytS/YehU family sensor histidine kinase